MSGLNVKINKFTWRNSFSLWQIKMRALLKQHRLCASLVKKLTDPAIVEMVVLEENAHSMMMFNIITEVAEEKTASGL